MLYYCVKCEQVQFCKKKITSFHLFSHKEGDVVGLAILIPTYSCFARWHQLHANPNVQNDFVVIQQDSAPALHACETVKLLHRERRQTSFCWICGLWTARTSSAASEL